MISATWSSSIASTTRSSAALTVTIAFVSVDGVRIAAAVVLILVGILYIAYVIWGGEK